MTEVALMVADAAPPAVQDSVLQLLLEVDAEFVPHLSVRANSVSTEVPASPSRPGLVRYFEAVRRESWLVALDGGGVVGLLSFLEGHEDSFLRGWSPSLYATTVAVAHRARRARVGMQLYDALEALARERTVPYLTTRTWTTNSAHLQLLLGRGFLQVAQRSDDRGAGVGTVYLACPVDLSPQSLGFKRFR